MSFWALSGPPRATLTYGSSFLKISKTGEKSKGVRYVTPFKESRRSSVSRRPSPHPVDVRSIVPFCSDDDRVRDGDSVIENLQPRAGNNEPINATL